MKSANLIRKTKSDICCFGKNPRSNHVFSVCDMITENGLHGGNSMFYGGTHILRHMGICCSNSLILHKKSLNMGNFFYKNIPEYGSVFPKFSAVRHAPIFRGKIPKKWVPFLPKWPLNMGTGFKAWAAHLCPDQIWVPPRFYHLLNTLLMYKKLKSKFIFS